jgi:hypothetical protein
MKYLYKANRVLCFILSAMMSFIFYSSLAGSSTFFFWFNGIIAVCFDLMRVELWDSGKKSCKALAVFFIAVSIIAFAGSSLAETRKASIRESDNTYISILESDILMLDEQIRLQGERVANTSADYGTAAQKENQIYQELLDKKTDKAKELLEYKKENKSEESVSSFDIYANLMGIETSTLMLWFFLMRAVLLEIAILYNVEPKKKEVNEGMTQKELDNVIEQIEKEPVMEMETERILEKIDAWEKNAVQKHQDENASVLKDVKKLVNDYHQKQRRSKLGKILDVNFSSYD